MAQTNLIFAANGGKIYIWENLTCTTTFFCKTLEISAGAGEGAL